MVQIKHMYVPIKVQKPQSPKGGDSNDNIRNSPWNFFLYRLENLSKQTGETV